MAEVVVMPQLGNTVQTCLVTSWHVSVGDAVVPSTVVASIETDKAEMEVPAGVTGTVLALLAAPGDEVLVKAPFFIVGEPGEDMSGLMPMNNATSEVHAVAGTAGQGGTQSAPAWVDLSQIEPNSGLETQSGSGAGQPGLEAHTDGIRQPGLEGQRAGMRETEPDTQPVNGSSVSPRARRVADEAGLDIAQVVGTGPHGRVMESDVRDAIEARDNGSRAVRSEAMVDMEPARTRGAEAETMTGFEHGTGIGGRVTRMDIENAALVEEAPHHAVIDEEVDTEVDGPQAGSGDQFIPESPNQVFTHADEDPPNPSNVELLRQDDLGVRAEVFTHADEDPPNPGDVELLRQDDVEVRQDDVGFPGAYVESSLVGIRKLVAERTMASLAQHAQLTFDASASAESLLRLRATFKGSGPELGMSGVTIGDLVAYAAVRVAMKHPSINATYQDKVLRTFERVHLGIAVDTPRGLLVPTIRDASAMGLSQFSARAKVVADQARSGNINPDMLTGATFTVTNLGAYGIESFTPILNSPQIAILGVNTILPRPVINPDGSISVERRISFSLTVDHAVVDGADAARFLQALAAYISTIEVSILAEGGINA